MTTPTKFICIHCDRFKPQSWSCAAFPNGIPNALDLGGADHRAALEGDGGFMFRPKSTEDAKRVVEQWGETPTPYVGKMNLENPSVSERFDEQQSSAVVRSDRGK